MTDIRIVGATIVADPETVLADAEIAFSTVTGRISYLGPPRGAGGPADIDGTGRIVAPGLINGHTHAGISLLRGHSDDEPLQQWLTHIRAFEVRMTRDDIRAGLLLSMAEMIKSGTVGFVDMFHWDNGLLADVSAAGNAGTGGTRGLRVRRRRLSAGQHPDRRRGAGPALRPWPRNSPATS